ncbi:type II secretion system protein [Clostridium sp. P21]|uniref:Type II secretion system protein n=1 Tax=Clostridium muellerianum TaxID=2716538 RepID=A0A7Y0EDF7_9CLOT|nr:type II secretion system protein [Clostridium muellerianum]NMM61393.1 type II secretion system protein [Clostridium muellerianum]
MRKNKLKGFMLIELMLVITIISILLSYSFLSLSGLNTLKNDIEAETFGNVMVNFINTSREYCRSKRKGGHIYLNVDRECLTLNCGLEEVNRLPLPAKFTLSIGRTGKEIKIDNKGMTGDACTIIFKDRKGKRHYVTVCVGTAYVDFKEERGIYSY